MLVGIYLIASLSVLKSLTGFSFMEKIFALCLMLGFLASAKTHPSDVRRRQ